MHGLLAGAGLTLLLYAGFTSGIPGLAWAGIALLAVAALAGIHMNLAYHTKLLPLPKESVVIHAPVAAAGFALIAWTSFR